jgi:competence protein ComEA
MVAWLVAAALMVVAVLRMLGGGGPAPPPARVDDGHGRAAGTAEGAAHAGGGGGLYVHVAGAVRRPGLLRISGSARVASAIARAGGPARGADLTAVNLAQPLEDGQQVIVPRRGGASQATAATPGEAGAPAGASTPSLATATLAQLDELDGIGPTLAKRIVEYRESHGGFRSLEELREVDGIGEKRFAALRKALRP